MVKNPPANAGVRKIPWRRAWQPTPVFFFFFFADKARDFIGKGHPGGEQEGQGTQENCSAAWLAVLGFMVMGLVSGYSSILAWRIPMDRGAWQAIVHRVAELDMTEATARTHALFLRDLVYS